MTAKIALRQQIEAVRFAETRQRTIMGGGTLRELRPPREAEHDMQRLGAAARTLEWLQAHEPEIRKLLEIPAERRALLWNHMAEVAELLDSKLVKPADEEGQS
ncbi:MAG: hypothetical protein GY873_08630 [Bosea sp.]|uniref:hypothetical protein n=1 Tax=Bosea sp. (in: a-proteobacteria) TaxID=1871050 RepID=UPI0023858859|nr:hypothetical protein [Bosea sp. (in: a-proteobacteria)]MCP4734244.1 hypothetical protein [Bosea sp. (in: a-proteobacteria)]